MDQGSPNQDFIRHGIQMMAESLTSTAGTGASLTTNGECLAVAGLVECLLKFLKGVLQTITDGTSSNGMSLSEAARTDSSDGILSGKVSLVDRLLSLISQADDIKDISVASALICGSLGCILEASLHSATLFESFKNAGRFQAILQKALLHDRRRPIRMGIARSIRSICDHPT